MNKELNNRPSSLQVPVPIPRWGAGVASRILISSFGTTLSRTEFIVPEGYDHENMIGQMKQNNNGCHVSTDFNDRNYNCVTNILKAKSEHQIDIIPIHKVVHGRECRNFMIDKNYAFVGAQGLVLAQGKELLTKAHCVASFDEENALYLGSSGQYMVPVSYYNSGRSSPKSHYKYAGLRLCLRPFNGPWAEGDFLLCYSKSN